MRLKAVLLISTLFALLLSLQFALPTLACIPNDEGTKCLVRPSVKPKPAIRVIPTKVPAPLALPAPVMRGTGPADALEMTDSEQTIQADESMWFKIGSGINPQHLQVWLDANGQSGIEFATYAPDQMGSWSPATPPKGRGTHNRLDPSHDLSWNAQAPAGGTWYIVVTNRNSAPLAFTLTYNRVEMLRRDCGSPYWEYLPSGAYIQWPGLCK